MFLSKLFGIFKSKKKEDVKAPGANAATSGTVGAAVGLNQPNQAITPDSGQVAQAPLQDSSPASPVNDQPDIPVTIPDDPVPATPASADSNFPAPEPQVEQPQEPTPPADEPVSPPAENAPSADDGLNTPSDDNQNFTV